MGNFQNNDRGGNRGGGFRGGNSGGRGGFGGGRGGNRGPVTMYKAVCDKCHKNCEVPFQPSGDKPIYCNECFGEKRGGDNRNGGRKDFGNNKPRREFNDKPMSSSQNGGSNISDDVKKQLSEMNSKLDRLISSLEHFTVTKTVVSPAKEAPKVTKISTKKVAVRSSVKKAVVKNKK